MEGKDDQTNHLLKKKNQTFDFAFLFMLFEKCAALLFTFAV